MCCCDFMLVEALIGAARVADGRNAELAPQRLAGMVQPRPVVAVDRAPRGTFGWSMPALVHRLWPRHKLGMPAL